MRALVAPNGTITEVWHYDSWGNPISPPAQRIEQPFLWNGAYGWTYTNRASKVDYLPPSFRFPPLREGNRVCSVPPASRGNLMEGVINCCFL